MILYHGSNQKVDNIDLGKSRPSKDFGLAFYLSEDIEQAKEMAQFKVDTFGGELFINKFEFDIKDGSLFPITKICIFIFARGNSKWKDSIVPF